MTAQKQMKAMAIDHFGGSDALHLTQLPVPEPKADEVQIKIAYTAVNPVDWKIREGLLKSRMPFEFPLVPGWDAAGTISKVGDNVKAFKVGDEVYAYCRKDKIKEGTYAEFICCPAEGVSLKPKNINFAEAASIPLAGLTAWQALFDVAKLTSGQICLIHAGAGGVGSLAIQFAKNKGAKVITTSSTINVDYVKKLGADIVIDYKKENFVDRLKKEFPQGIDVVFDLLGGQTWKDSSLVLKANGCLVSLIVPTPDEQAKTHKIRFEYLFVKPNGKELSEIAALIEKGKVKVPAIEEMTLSEAASAMEKNKSGHTRGKIVLKVQ